MAYTYKMLSKILSIIVLATQVLVGASFASDKNPLGGGGLATPTVPVPAKFREFSDFCITEKWKFHLACLRNKDDAPQWIQDNYEKNGEVGFYEESIWKYIPKAIIDVCCDGKSDILPGVHANAFSPANWRALLLKKSIAQCLKYLQSEGDSLILVWLYIILFPSPKKSLSMNVSSLCKMSLIKGLLISSPMR